MSDAATLFILMAIQDWGQSEEDGTRAVQAVLDAAGFAATASGRPVFGGIWPKKCTGPEGDAASSWLQSLTDTMKRGRFQTEVECVQAAIDRRIAAR
jgi:hypothetical protein